MAKLADARDLGSRPERGVGSSPTIRSIKELCSIIKMQRREFGQKPLTDVECIAMACKMNRRYKDELGDVEMANAVDPISENVGTQNNDRFKTEDAITFTDLLTKRKYRLIAVGEEVPSSPELAASHLVKTFTKTVISLNQKHETDFFWGEMTIPARKSLKDAGITNVTDLLAGIDGLKDVPSNHLVEVIKMIVDLKGVI